MAVTILKPNCKEGYLMVFLDLFDSKLNICEYWTGLNQQLVAAQALHTLLSKAAYIFCPTYTGGARDQTATDSAT